MWTKLFWKALAERSISSGAEALLLVLGADELLNMFEVSPQEALGFFVGGMFLAVLKGLAANAVTSNGPGIGYAETLSYQ